MPRYYTTELEVASFNPTAGDGILIVEAPSDLVLQIVKAAVYNTDNDTHEMLHMAFLPVTVKGPLVGASTPLIRQHDNGDAASTVITYGADANGMTTEPTTWGDPYDDQGFSNLNGYEFNPPLTSLLAGPIVSPAGLAGIRLIAVPSVAFGLKALITFAEVGG